MPIFPNLGPQYLNEDDRGIQSRMQAFYADSISINQSFWAEGDTDLRFYLGDQTIFNDVYGNVPIMRRRQYNFNRIRATVDTPSGYQRRNRKSITAIPVENGDNLTADQFTKILLWTNQQEQYLDTVSDAFHGACITGMNLLQVWLDYRSDPISGDIKVDNLSYNQYIIDPYFRKADLSDCHTLWKRSYVTREDALSLLPEHAEAILAMTGVNNRDGKFQYMPESYNYGTRNLFVYDEFYYRDYRNQRMLVDTQTGEKMEWRGKDEDDLRFFLQTYPTITVIDQDIPTYRLAIVLQGKLMMDGPQPMGIDRLPFIPVMAYFNPQTPYYPWRIQGIVRGVRDAQFLYNRRKIAELDLIESQISSGWKYKENALVNPLDVFNLTGAGKGLALKEEAQMTDVEQIAPPQVPPSMFQMSEILAKEIQQISGVNEELLGSAVDDKAGILSMLRQGAGLTTLQILFDQLDRSLKLLGRVMLDTIQVNYTPGKVKKIVGEEPSPQFYNKAFGRYDIAVEEGLNTTTQKQMQFAQMLYLREAGVPISASTLLDAATLQNKNKIIEEALRTEQQQQQIQQQQAQLKMQELVANIKLAEARATADEGLGLERLSRIEENRALALERKAAAIRDEDAALFDKVRALKELDGIDIAHIEKLVQLAQALMLQEKERVVPAQAPVIPESQDMVAQAGLENSSLS